MNPAAPSPTVRRSLLRRVLKGVVLLLVAALVAHAANVLRHQRAIARLEKDARARGEPLSLAELAAACQAPIPDSNNAALPLLAQWKERDPEYWQAFLDGKAELGQPRPHAIDPQVPLLGAKAKPVLPGVALPPEALAAAEAHLKAQAGHLEALHAALTRPAARFPIRLTNGFTMLLPHLAGLKGESQLLRLESVVAIERGDPNRALRALDAMARLGNLASDEPMLISQLVRIACQAATIAGAEHLLSRWALAAPQLDQLAATADLLQSTGLLRRALLGERASALDFLKARATQFEAISGSPGSGSGLRWLSAVGLTLGDQQLLLESLSEGIALADTPLPGMLEGYAELQQRTQARTRGFPPKLFTSMLLPALEKIPEKFANLEAKRRTLLTAIALERHRLAHDGRLPGRLEELVPRFLPAVPQDAFAEGPLLYRALPSGYVVYSVGPDRQDNRGRDRDNKAKGPFDLPFTVTR